MSRISRSSRLFLLLAVLFAGAMHAQQPATVSFRVFTSIPGAQFTVDGQIYTSSANFQWPIGSKHLVTFVQSPPPPLLDPNSPTLTGPAQLSPDQGTSYSLTSWKDSTGLLSPQTGLQTVTADPAVQWLEANVLVSYRVLLNFFDHPPVNQPPNCGAPGSAPTDVVRAGLVYIGAQCYWNNVVVYFPASTPLVLNAFPYPGFVFTGWSGSTGQSNSYLERITLNGPMTITPIFVPAKRVRVETNPLGLDVLVDRTTTPTLTSEDTSLPCPQSQGLPVSVPVTFTPLCRGDFDFAPGSLHLIGATSPQTDLYGKLWVFDSWGSATGLAGQGQNAIYTTDNITSAQDKVIVKFLPGARASFVTSPPGLPLTVDGRSNWAAYNFVWAIGSTHQVSAAPQLTDSGGRKYSFTGWSNGGASGQTVTMDQAAVDSGFRLVATYSVLSRLTVQSTPSGQQFQIDGTPCQTPCTVDRPSGTQVRLTAPSSIQMSDSVRLDLAAWSDGGIADHFYTINSDTQTLTANYTTSYRLSTGSDPANGASFRFDPMSPDTFYPAGNSVTVSADNLPGFKFRRWAGDLSGTYPSGYLTMSAPHAVVALMDRVPYIAPTGLQNAAGATPDSAVAPGSLIAITGESLASDSITGRVNPLAQTLGGLTVTIGDRILALVSVSPQRVIAQLSSDLSAGDYTLQLHAQGQPDVSANFTVARNAPGIFATITHADGTQVTSDSPAVVGEVVTVLGTGFGPYASPVIDGFYPSDPAPVLSDPVDVLIGDQSVVVQPASVTAAPGYTGMVALQLKIADPIPTGATVSLQVRVNGRLSNQISLITQ